MTGKYVHILAAGAALFVISSASAQEKQLTVANFGGLVQDLVRQVYFDPFAKTGVKFTEDSRDYGIGVLRTKIESGSSNWDVVAAEDIEIIQGCEEGLLEKIDFTKIPASTDMIPDAVLECGLGEILYNMAIAYNPDKTAEAPKDWTDFWNTEKWPGKRSLYKDPRDTLEAALMADGVAPADVYKVLATPEGQDRAFKSLEKLLPNIVWWTNPGQSRQFLASGEAVFIATYDSGINATNLREGTKNKVVTNNSIRHIDYWAIPSGAKNIDTAYEFLNFASEPERQGEFASAMGISVPNTMAMPHVKPEVVPLLSANPDNVKTALQSNAEFWLDNYESLNKRFTAFIGN